MDTPSHFWELFQCVDGTGSWRTSRLELELDRKPNRWPIRAGWRTTADPNRAGGLHWGGSNGGEKHNTKTYDQRG